MSDLAHLQSFLSERDREVLRRSGYGGRMGFGCAPALLVIDATWGFCGDRSQPLLEAIERWPNACGEAAWQAVDVIAQLARAFRAAGRPVIYTAGGYRPDKQDMGSWLWKHVRSAEAAPVVEASGEVLPHPDEVVSPLTPEPADWLIRKQKPSAFFGTPLQSHLTLLGVDSLVVTGGTTSGCVRASVVDAFSANYRVAVVEQGCFDRSEASHAVSLLDMNAKYADVVSTAEVLNVLCASADCKSDR